MNLHHPLRVLAIFSIAVVFGVGSFIPGTRAGSTLSLAQDTAVLLNGSGITLILATGSSLVSYSADVSALTLNLDVGSSVTIKSNNLYALTNSQSQPTRCSASPAYSYVTFSAIGPEAVTITPSVAVACSNTAPVIASFNASPASITSGQSSVLSWSISGADTASIDNGLGLQPNSSSSSVSVSPTQTTTYTISAVNYLGTTTAQTTVTVTVPTGGGGGGALVVLPTIKSFSASPATIPVGQSSILSWTVTGASTASITPSVATSGLNPVSGTATVTPATTTTYTLAASNGYGQSITATATVTITAAAPVSVPAMAYPPLSQSATSSVPTYCLVKNSGTFFLILNGIRRGVANPGLLYSYGYSFGDAIPDSAAYQSLAMGDLLGPGEGALVQSPASATVYAVSQGTKHGFTSVSVFRGLGYRFSSVLTIPAAQLDALGSGSIISSKAGRHLPGAQIASKGTIYSLGADARYPYPSLSVFNSWNLANDFSRVVPANAADLALPQGPAVTVRSSCNG